MFSEPEREVSQRMLLAFTEANGRLSGTMAALPKSWGWQGRTLSGRVDAPDGPAWLRLVHTRTDRANSKVWEGPQAAEYTMPPAVPRPRLRQRLTWTENDDSYLAELYDLVSEPTVTTGSPMLRHLPDLSGAWWTSLRAALDTVSAVPTDRVAVRQAYLDRAMPQFLGQEIDTTVPAWSTAHGDLHWANLTCPTLTILDWEGWGIAPAGFDAAMLHSYSLLVPGISAQVRRHLAHALDSSAGRFAELVVITQLLQTNSRGDNLELAIPLRQRAAELLGRPT
ncbi:hypothetical protein [Streptomyces violarus]|uniref:hypothetical protein n=1 Tax=Streptomyces violarus TaxID=67380 RepID=UPI0021C1D101|nr:hypothetical protein [Streptomyces violarus]MCT9139974.1 hypothetical protein [Streptomyces violarus]